MASSLNRPCQSKNIPKPRSCEIVSLPSNHQSGCFPAIGFSRTWRNFLLTTVVSVLWQKWPQKVPFALFKSHLSWSFLRKSENVTICSQLGGTPVKRGHLPFHLSAVRCWHHKDPTRSTTSRRSLRSLRFLWSLWSLWTCCLAFASRWSGAKRTCITWSLCTHWHWIQQIAHKSVKLSDLSTSYAHHKDIVFIFIYIHIILYLYSYCGNKSSDTKPRHCAPECQSVQLEGQPWAHLARRVTGSRRQLRGVTSPWHVSYCIYHLSIKFIQFGISQITVLDSFGVWSWRVVGMVSFGYFSLSMFDPFWPLLHLVWMLGSSGTSWPASVMSTPSV